jgi:hypothetical protein
MRTLNQGRGDHEISTRWAPINLSQIRHIMFLDAFNGHGGFIPRSKRFNIHVP